MSVSRYASDITARGLAWRCLVPVPVAIRWCELGRVRGAWFDPVTAQWRIPLPVVMR